MTRPVAVPASVTHCAERQVIPCRSHASGIPVPAQQQQRLEIRAAAGGAACVAKLRQELETRGVEFQPPHPASLAIQGSGSLLHGVDTESGSCLGSLRQESTRAAVDSWDGLGQLMPCFSHPPSRVSLQARGPVRRVQSQVKALAETRIVAVCQRGLFVQGKGSQALGEDHGKEGLQHVQKLLTATRGCANHITSGATNRCKEFCVMNAFCSRLQTHALDGISPYEWIWNRFCDQMCRTGVDRH